MPTSAVDSVIFRDIFGDADMRRVWSDENRTQRYLDFEAALARAQASIGMISKEAAAEITRVCKVENTDFVQLEKETLNIGYPVLGVVHQIARLCRGDAGNYCHWGAHHPGHHGHRHCPPNARVLRTARRNAGRGNRGNGEVGPGPP